MRVMVWNVFWRWGGNFAERSPAIDATLEELRPDVLGLVETWADRDTSQPDRIADLLSSRSEQFHAVFARTGLPPEPEPIEYPEQEGVSMGIGLVSRWPILEHVVHELPHAQRGGAPVTAMRATIDHPNGPLHVIVTCLEPERHYAGDQLAQAQAVADLLTHERYCGALPVLVLGDLNAGVEDPVIAPLTASLRDAFIDGGGDPTAVTLDPSLPHPPHLVGRRIDHILLRSPTAGRPVHVERAFVAGTHPIGGVHPSDHYAVLADIALG